MRADMVQHARQLHQLFVRWPVAKLLQHCWLQHRFCSTQSSPPLPPPLAPETHNLTAKKCAHTDKSALLCPRRISVCNSAPVHVAGVDAQVCLACQFARRAQSLGLSRLSTRRLANLAQHSAAA